MDDVNNAVWIFVVLEHTAGCYIFTPVEVAAVRRECRFTRVLLPVSAFGELKSAATGNMIQPHFTSSQRPRVAVMLPPDKILAVRRPDGVVDLSLLLFCHLFRVRAVGIHIPKIVDAVPVAGEGDLLAVGTEPRLNIERGSGRQTTCLAAGDRENVQISEEVEHDLLSVGTDIDGHPGSFVGGKADVRCRSVLGSNVPCGVRLFCGVFWRRCLSEGENREEKHEAQLSHGGFL